METLVIAILFFGAAGIAWWLYSRGDNDSGIGGGAGGGGGGGRGGKPRPRAK